MKVRTFFDKAGVIMMILALTMSVLTGCSGNTDRSSDEVKTQENADSAGMVHLETVEDVTAFMSEVYEGVAQDMLPHNIETNEIDISDEDMVEYHTGLANLTGIDGVYLSESMMSSVAYSAIYIRTTDDADADDIMKQLMDSVNPAKWICVTAEQQYAVRLGNDIFFVMSSKDTAKAVLDSAIKAAQGKEMKISDTLEKANPL